MNRTIAEWQKAAYECEVSKGFHDCKACGGLRCPACKGTGLTDPFSPTRIGSRLALIHCEISKATECVVWGEMGLDLDDHVYGKSVGFPIALAGVFLSLCDLAESLRARLDENAPLGGLTAEGVDTPEKLCSELNHLHYVLSDWTNDERPKCQWGFALTQFLYALRRLASACDVDLLAMAELEHQFNLTRPRMHGGRLL